MGFRGLSSSSIMEVCKYMLAVTCGYILKSMVDIPPANHCPRCAECPAAVLDPHASNQSVHSAFKPHSMYEVLRYDFFTSKHLYNNMDDNPRIGLLSHQKQDIKDILAQAELLFNIAKSSRWKISELFHGYKRVDPLQGEEYQLDVLLTSQTHDEERHRLHLIKPFSLAHLISHTHLEEAKMIHFILPLSSASERFDAFMNNFEQICKESKEHIYLLIVMFLSKTDEDNKTIAKVKSRMKSITQRHHHAHMRTLQTYKPFSRALGIDLGSKQLPEEALLFFCDVDVSFTLDFMQRCQENAVLKQQVFYPMLFAQYMPAIVTQYSPASSTPRLNDINKYTGHWVHYGYGMTCLYNADYHSVGGYNTSIVGWGGEDVDLYQRHVTSKLQVFRAAEPGLVHIYHNKTCSDALSARQQEMCRGSLAEGIGSRQQLANYIVHMQNTEESKKRNGAD